MISSLRYSILLVLAVVAGNFVVCASAPGPVPSIDSVHIREIVISGLEKTQEVTVRRELLFETHTNYARKELPSRIKQSVSQVKNLNLFNDIRMELVYDSVMSSDSGAADLLVHVIEKWYTWPLPFVEFADRNFNQWWRFDFDPDRTNYGLYLFKYNVAGLNQTVKLALINGYSRDLGITYTVPFLTKHQNIGFSFYSGIRKNKEIWYATRSNELQFFADTENDMISRFSSGASVIYRQNKKNQFFAGAGFDRIQVDDTIVTPELNPEFLVDNGTEQKQYSTFVAFAHEGRDNRLFPTQGKNAGASYSLVVLNNTSHILHLLYANASKYHVLTRRWSLAGMIAGKASNMKSQPYYNFKSFGYSQIVRGYENYVVEGQHYGIAKMGLRFHVLDNAKFRINQIPMRLYKLIPVSLFLEVFSDAGYVVNNSGIAVNSLQNTWLNGVGIGLNMSFYFDKVVRFEYSRNHLNEYGLYINFKKSF